MLEVKNLTKIFVKKPHPFSVKKIHIHALQDISFVLKANNIYGIVGKTGSGKTTLGRILCGLLDYEEGGMAWDKKAVSKKTDIQMIFQNAAASLNPRLTILEILREPLENLKVPHSQCEKKIKGFIKTVDFPEYLLNVYPDQISGGQRQKVCIIRALLVKPRVLVCDEIISHLDLDSQVAILNLLRKLKEENNLTIIFISHDLRTVYNISDFIIVIDNGQVVKKLDKNKSTYEDLSRIFLDLKH